ncbi:MAG: GGDEF domain-containing protein [Treponemataceae bacterium]|nr:GGDEF domain-containing protein [Treponemataceae bacterium]
MGRITPFKNLDSFSPVLFVGFPLATLLGGMVGLITGIGGVVGITVLTAGLTYGYALYRHRKKNSPPPEENVTETPSEQKQEIPPDRIDPVTGLANTNGLMAWFSEKGKKFAENNRALMVLAADLANYQDLVRSRGQNQADAILKEVASRIATFAGSEGIAARTGSNEFAVVATILPRDSLELVAEQAGKLTEVLQRPIEYAGSVIWIGGSVGAARGGALEGPAILEKARKALEQARQEGAGHYVVADFTGSQKG